MYFLAAEILFALWAVGFAHQQSPCIKDRRDFVPANSPNNVKFHDRGMLLSTYWAAFLIGLLYGVTLSWLQCVLIAPCFIAIYKIFFDGIIGLEIHDDFFYLGTTSKQDRWIKGKMTGNVKVIV